MLRKKITMLMLTSKLKHAQHRLKEKYEVKKGHKIDAYGHTKERDLSWMIITKNRVSNKMKAL
jgi:hypothetical protein